MRRTSKKNPDKALDNQVNDLFNKHGSGIQFNIMDLGNLHNDTKNAIKSGTDPDQAMLDAIAKYRKN
jgi:hypothetical protein